MVYVKQAVLAIILAILGSGSAMATEEAKYKAVLKEQSFEVREYEPHILAETIVDGDFDNAGSKAFSRLFKYISGTHRPQGDLAGSSRSTHRGRPVLGFLE